MFTIDEIRKTVEENKDEALQCLIEALQSPSPTGSELPMAETMIKWLKKAGLPVEIYEYVKDRPNVLASWKGSEEGKTFLFNGHFDVFPPSETDNQLYNAWSGDVKNGYVYGRGASDMKSGDCAALIAVMLLKKMGFDPKGTITINYVSDEENGGKDGILAMLDEGIIKGDFGISMEPSDLDVVVAHGGTYPCQIIVYGDGGHSSKPIDMNDKDNQYGGEDAIKKAVKALSALYKLQNIVDKRKTDFGKTNLAVTKISAGNVVNNYARRAEILIDRRYFPPETPESVDAEIIAALDEIKNSDPTFKYEFHSHYEPDTPVCEIPDDSLIVSTIDEVCEELFGQRPKHLKISGGADAAYIKRAIGTEMPWFGPGRFDGGIATAEERVAIDDYLNCIAAYMLVLVKLMA